MSDIANAADFFDISVAELVMPLSIISNGSQSHYQVRHDVAPDNAQLAGAAGPRYIVKPDDPENGKERGAATGPRALVMPYDLDFPGPCAVLRRSPRNRFELPHLDSNQDKGFQRPVCCHYTMGESWVFHPQVFIYTIYSAFVE